MNIQNQLEDFLVVKNCCSVKSFTTHVNNWLTLFDRPLIEDDQMLEYLSECPYAEITEVAGIEYVFYVKEGVELNTEQRSESWMTSDSPRRLAWHGGAVAARAT